MRSEKLALSALFLLGIAPLVSAQQVELQPRMGDPVPGLSPGELALFNAGQAEFELILDQSQGLGPIFNDTSCAQCHSTPVTGGFSGITVTRFGVMASGGSPFDPLASLGGSLLQKSFVLGLDPSCEEVVPVAADVTALRSTPHIFGAGLVENLDDQDIIDLANTPPDGFVSGVVRMVVPVEGGPARAGKFGWKGGVPTMLTFSADASLNEMGLTNDFFPVENAPNGDASLLGAPTNCDTVADPEDTGAVGTRRIDRQTDFQLLLAAPPQTPKSGMTGETIFNSIGCNSCHVSTFTTDAGAPIAALAGKTIKPYGDFLLHDMGDPLLGGLGDGIVDGIADESTMMTRALWGMGLRDGFLHDLRSTGGTFQDNVDDAIAEHDGEATNSRLLYQALSLTDQALLGDFLRSLGRAEFDYDGPNNQVDVFDWFFLEFDGVFSGPVPGSLTPDDDGAVADLDQDGDFDMEDWAGFQRAFTN